MVLPAGQRRLAWGLTSAGEPLVAADHVLVLPDGTTLAYHDVERVSWRRPELLIVQSAPIEGTGFTHRLRLHRDGDLPEVIHTRVTGSVAWQQHRQLSSGGGVRVVGRRQPGKDALGWQLVFDPGTDINDPELLAEAGEHLRLARRTLG